MTPQLVCFDFDGTLVQGFPPEAPYIWRMLHDHLGSPRDVLDLKRKEFIAGGCTYDAWFHHDLKWFRKAGARRGDLLAAIDRLHAVSGAREVMDTLRERGVHVAVLSGSVDLACDRFFPDRPFDAILLNRLHFDADDRLVGGESTPYDMGRKADGLRHLADRFGVALRDTIFVGDAENDVDAAKAAGRSIAFNCRDARLAAVATHVFPAPAADLRVILPYLA